MTSRNDEKLAPEVRDLIERAAPEESAPDEVRERLWSRLEDSVAPATVPGGEDGSAAGDSSATGDSSAAGQASVDAEATSAMGLESASQISGLLSGAKAVGIGLTFAAGAATGALGVQVMHEEPEPEVVEVVRHVEVPVPIVEEFDEEPEEVVVDEVEEVDEPREEVTEPEEVPDVPDEIEEPTADEPEQEVADPEEDAPPDQPDTPLSAERLLLSQAQSALARGRAGDALESLAEHERRFPEGILAEERKALEVSALQLDGRPDEAREAAEAFIEQYPRSIFRDLVNQSLDE